MVDARTYKALKKSIKLKISKNTRKMQGRVSIWIFNIRFIKLISWSLKKCIAFIYIYDILKRHIWYIEVFYGCHTTECILQLNNWQKEKEKEKRQSLNNIRAISTHLAKHLFTIYRSLQDPLSSKFCKHEDACHNLMLASSHLKKVIHSNCYWIGAL